MHNTLFPTKMKNLVINLLIATTLLSLFACTEPKQDDIVPPTLENLKLNNTTTNDPTLTLTAGNNLTLTAQLQDNKSLKEFYVEISNNFDAQKGKTQELQTPFAFQKSYLINPANTTDYNINETIQIPQTAAAGNYYLLIYALDDDINQTDKIIQFFNISAPGQPQINLTQPSTQQTITLNPEQTITLNGTITDNTLLTNLNIKLLTTDNNFMPLPQFEPILQQNTPINQPNFELSQINPITIPADIIQGKYLLVLKTADNEGNYNTQKIKIIIN